MDKRQCSIYNVDNKDEQLQLKLSDTNYLYLIGELKQINWKQCEISESNYSLYVHIKTLPRSNFWNKYDS